MAILDTLYILFKGDASSVKKSAGEAETAIKSFLNVFAGVASAATVFAAFKSSINEVTSIGNLSRELNVNAESLDAWGHAVQRTGGTAEQFQSTLKGLSEHFGTTPETALKLLPRLADTFSRLNQFQANSYGKSLGIDQSTIYLLQQGRREIEDTIQKQKSLGLVTQEQVEITRKYDNALYDAGRAYSTFTRELSIPLLPGFTKAINYLVEHQDAVKGALLAIGIGAASIAIPFVAANFAVLAVYTSIGLLIGAFALVFDDIRAFQKGAKSITGEIVELKKTLGQKIESAGDALPKWLQILTGHNALKSGSTTTASNFSNPFSGFSLPSLSSLTGHNALKTTNVNVGNITINTAATDADGIAASFIPSLKDHIFQLNSQVDDGVFA